MTHTIVTTTDFERKRRASIILETGEFDKIARIWDNEDRILVQMQDHPFFAGRTRWRDLDPVHFRLMVMQNLSMASRLSDDEFLEESNPVIVSLNFVLGALVYCLRQKASSRIDLLRITRFAEQEVAFDFSATMETMEKGTPPPRQQPFRVVVDNNSN